MNPDARIVEPGQMEPPMGEIPFLFLPPGDMFTHRARRLRFLSKAHRLTDYLAFLATLADAQHDALTKFPAYSLQEVREQATLSPSRSMPFLNARFLSRNPVWRRGLSMILQQMSGAALPQAARETVSRLLVTGEAALEDAADKILAGEFPDVSPQELPFIAAALQVYWVHMTISLGRDSFGRTEQGGLCPVCGSHPIVGIVQSGGAKQGLRYLSCSLCASQWHMVRIKCSSCEATDGIDYFKIGGSSGAVKAESCGRCNTYLKLLYLAEDPGMEATADDMATLALDMLMDKEGKARRGPNLYLHPGTPH
jgi:FdhE protein